MASGVSRRGFLRQAAGAAGASLAAPHLLGAEAAGSPARATVALVQGDERRRIVAEALGLIEEQILPVLRTKKSVVIKANCVSTTRPLAATHRDAINGILDFLGPHWKGPVFIAESSAGDTGDAFENFEYGKIASEHPRHEVTLVDLNAEGLYEQLQILDDDIHLQPVRLAARLLDPEAYIINAGPLKTHNAVVATLSIKNMALGAPLRSGPGESPRWSDKRRYHVGIRQMHYNILLTAQRMKPFWGATVIDGFEGMEGNGPAMGLPVPSRIAIASTDFVAADRVGVEAMEIDPSWVGYLGFCGQVGLGCYDLDRIDVRGAKLAEVKRKYQLHRDIDRQLQWMGPMRDLPPRLG
ncbi:MAG: DUF362 domain-containing protein [Acidobacteriota bacterium]